jgi:catechol 2,3-dioxygenase-like lactoylglutathione lyase family enzyme
MSSATMLGVLLTVALPVSTASSATGPGAHGVFTSEVLPVLYVTDVLRSVGFYGDLGFELRHFYDYDSGTQVKEWTRATPPIWALFAAGEFEFALHLTQDRESFLAGGQRHYFLVEDVDAHRSRVAARGIDAGDLIDRPWMRMFGVTDPDGHRLFFGTRPTDEGASEGGAKD